MKDISDGFVTISDELTIFPSFSFEQFKCTKFYKNQDGVRIIYLDEQQIINNRKYNGNFADNDLVEDVEKDEFKYIKFIIIHYASRH